MSNDKDTFFTKSENETTELGKKFASKLNLGDTVAFYGDLGAGKTEFIKGICEYFNVKEIVTSPTFTIMNKYKGEISGNEFGIFHIDLYRIKDTKDLAEIGFQDCVYSDNAIKLIEWAEKANSQLQDTNYNVIISFSDDEDERVIDIEKLSD